MRYLMMFISLTYSQAFASTGVSDLGIFLNKNIDQFEDRLLCSALDANYIHINVGSSVAFDIPKIVEVALVPEFTLIWTKENEVQ